MTWVKKFIHFTMYGDCCMRKVMDIEDELMVKNIQKIKNKFLINNNLEFFRKLSHALRQEILNVVPLWRDKLCKKVHQKDVQGKIAKVQYQPDVIYEQALMMPIKFL